jgi:hypothetical protein
MHNTVNGSPLNLCRRTNSPAQYPSIPVDFFRELAAQNATMLAKSEPPIPLFP